MPRPYPQHCPEKDYSCSVLPFLLVASGSDTREENRKITQLTGWVVQTLSGAFLKAMLLVLQQILIGLAVLWVIVNHVVLWVIVNHVSLLLLWLGTEAL